MTMKIQPYKVYGNAEKADIKGKIIEIFQVSSWTTMV